MDVMQRVASEGRVVVVGGLCLNYLLVLGIAAC